MGTERTKRSSSAAFLACPIVFDARRLRSPLCGRHVAKRAWRSLPRTRRDRDSGRSGPSGGAGRLWLAIAGLVAIVLGMVRVRCRWRGGAGPGGPGR